MCFNTGHCFRTYLNFQDLILEMLACNIVPFCNRNQYLKNQIYRVIIPLIGNDYRVTKRANRSGRTDGPTLIIENIRF